MKAKLPNKTCSFHGHCRLTATAILCTRKNSTARTRSHLMEAMRSTTLPSTARTNHPNTPTMKLLLMKATHPWSTHPTKYPAMDTDQSTRSTNLSNYLSDMSFLSQICFSWRFLLLWQWCAGLGLHGCMVSWLFSKMLPFYNYCFAPVIYFCTARISAFSQIDK